MNETTRLLSYGDLARAFADANGRPNTRAILDRYLRDYARQLPDPVIIAGRRLWPPEMIDALRAVIERDQETGR